ncbi:hypothetical protein, partial [Rhodopirellula bahusiensis]|uniref:hypothetical protein n=1 Tax=Rhodopirellula bahusiensis TaxID=2014065 RepID=UPI0032967FAB
THPKFRALMRMLCVPQYAAVGILESVWMLASQFADDGDLTRFTAEEIADYVAWGGDAEKLLSVLIECRWLDNDDGRVVIHDWQDHCPRYVSDRISKRQRRAQVSENVGDSPRQSDSVGKNRRLPSQVKSNQTKSKCASRKRDASDCELFDQWWEHYPKKVDKKLAKQNFPKSIASIRKAQTIDDAQALAWLIEQTRGYAMSVANTDPKYIKGPSAWLNGERFLDEAPVAPPEEVRDAFDPEVDAI